MEGKISFVYYKIWQISGRKDENRDDKSMEQILKSITVIHWRMVLDSQSLFIIWVCRQPQSHLCVSFTIIQR